MNVGRIMNVGELVKQLTTFCNDSDEVKFEDGGMVYVPSGHFQIEIYAANTNIGTIFIHIEDEDSAENSKIIAKRAINYLTQSTKRNVLGFSYRSWVEGMGGRLEAL